MASNPYDTNLVHDGYISDVTLKKYHKLQPRPKTVACKIVSHYLGCPKF